MHEWEDFRVSDVSGLTAVPEQALLSMYRQPELQILNRLSSKNNLIVEFEDSHACLKMYACEMYAL
jgi:hypothetical protein